MARLLRDYLTVMTVMKAAGERHDRPGAAARERTPDPWRLALSGMCASLVGIGLARFAFTPLLPALIDQHWFTAANAAFLGATNLAGYLLGVLGAGMLARHVPARWLLRASMLLAAASLLACAWRIGFAWFFAWRLVSGIAGGIAMILAAPTVLAHVRDARHGIVGGAIFLGVGLGITASGTLVPLLVRFGLVQTWLGLGATAAILCAIGWGGWPRGDVARPPRRTSAEGAGARAIGFVSATYALNAFGLVPHMVFLVAFVARGLGQGLDAGTRYWVLFGLGASAGPVLLGHLADRVGPRRALRVVLLLELVFVGLPCLTSGAVALILSSGVVGACTIGVVPVVLARTRAILRHHPAAQAPAWRRATTGFAVFQAAGGYALSYLFGRSGGDYRLLFALGAAAMLLALAVEWMTPEDDDRAAPPKAASTIAA